MVAVGLGLLAHVVAGGTRPGLPVLAGLTALLSMIASLTARIGLPAWLRLVFSSVASRSFIGRSTASGDLHRGRAFPASACRRGASTKRETDHRASHWPRALPGPDAGRPRRRGPADSAAHRQSRHVGDTRFGLTPPREAGRSPRRPPAGILIHFRRVSWPGLLPVAIAPLPKRTVGQRAFYLSQ